MTARARAVICRREDLRDYKVERRRPLEIEMRSSRVHLNPPPSMGGILVAFGIALWQALGKLPGGFGGTPHLRRLVEVMRATARARIEIGLEPLRLPSQELLEPTLIQRYRDEIADRPPVARGTTQISVIDAEGGAASLSVSNGEGSGYVLPGTGMILNNMLGEADLNPEGSQGWPTDTRMSSMMTPAIVLDAKGALTALGSGGSNRIRTAMLQALLNLLVFGYATGRGDLSAPAARRRGQAQFGAGVPARRRSVGRRLMRRVRALAGQEHVFRRRPCGTAERGRERWKAPETNAAAARRRGLISPIGGGTDG